MKDSDKVAIITSLVLLNKYIEESLEKSKERKKYWNESIEKYGEDAIVDEYENITYKQILNRNIKNIESHESNLKKNKRLIKMLEGELHG